MGAGIIQPVMTAFTQVKPPRADKMLANAVEAAEQCEVLSIPRIAPEIALDALLSSTGSATTACAASSSPTRARQSDSPLRPVARPRGSAGRPPHRPRGRIFRRRTQPPSCPKLCCANQSRPANPARRHRRGGRSGRASGYHRRLAIKGLRSACGRLLSGPPPAGPPLWRPYVRRRSQRFPEPAGRVPRRSRRGHVQGRKAAGRMAHRHRAREVHVLPRHQPARSPTRATTASPRCSKASPSAPARARFIDNGNVIGLKGPDGWGISLEPGGQFELSGAPRRLDPRHRARNRRAHRARQRGRRAARHRLPRHGRRPQLGARRHPADAEIALRDHAALHGQGRHARLLDDDAHLHHPGQPRLRLRSRHGQEVPRRAGAAADRHRDLRQLALRRRASPPAA